MKILLQETKTGLYYQEPDAWIREVEAASDFGTSQRAIDYVCSQCLSGTRVVAAFLGSRYVELVAFPIKPSWRRHALARA